MGDDSYFGAASFVYGDKQRNRYFWFYGETSVNTIASNNRISALRGKNYYIKLMSKVSDNYVDATDATISYCINSNVGSYGNNYLQVRSDAYIQINTYTNYIRGTIGGYQTSLYLDIIYENKIAFTITNNKTITLNWNSSLCPDIFKVSFSVDIPGSTSITFDIGSGTTTSYTSNTKILMNEEGTAVSGMVLPLPPRMIV
jgi:hypothetical protein